ncbi:hypothetical protein [Cellulomonas humilata]|uniref:SMI1/KNR4 family protein n=1 Tax=Cellulomonas humilata TaxID=144055 RepID=A0ABU0EDF1_9CELL|nr:hypothetical protein [Cellulomonas humilata]MDQ0373289.1 hypothetical protein [Cellulomonas humilata]
MASFAEVTLSRVPAGIDVPEPLRMLFEWVDAHGFTSTGRDGELYGSLSAEWPGPGTNLLLRGYRPGETADYVAAWFGSARGESPTLWPFCRTGADGSVAALWRAPDSATRIVHLGSGSGSLLTCVLGDDAVDFLRLIGIGYDEICWSEDWSNPPVPEPDRSVLNEPYRTWVESTFDVTIPRTAVEIVPDPAEMGDDGTADTWCRWVDAATS